MSEATQTQPQPTEDKKPILGILSTIFGGISMVPFLGIVSPLGLILGVIGLWKDSKKLMSIIGTSISVVGILTSPTLWVAVSCTLDSESCVVQDEDTASLNEIKNSLVGMDKIVEKAVEDAIKQTNEKVPTEMPKH